MTLLKSLVAAGALAFAAVGAAHADTRGTWLLLDDSPPGVFVDTWSFDSTSFDALPPGTSFQDYFIFNPPTDEDVTISVTGDGVTLDHFTLRIYTDFSVVATQAAAGPGALSGGPYALTIGTYWLDLYGVSDLADGHYQLQISGTQGDETTPPVTLVPEPGAATLLLAGLLAVAARTRRAARRAAG